MRPRHLLPSMMLLGLVSSPLFCQYTPAKLPALDPAGLEQGLKSQKWLIMEFGGQTCIPCIRMQPVLMEIQKKLGDKGKVHNFWIQEHVETARRFGIMVMPTQIIFDAKGKEILRHQGYWELESFQKVLKEKGVL